MRSLKKYISIIITLKRLRLNLAAAICILTFMVDAQEGLAQNDQNFQVEGKTDCNSLPEVFQNQRQALLLIRNTKFSYSQEMNTTRRNGYQKAHYRSCDLSTGFLLIEIDGSWLIHPEVPLELWEKYVSSRDLEGFYKENIMEVYPSIRN